MTRNRLGQEASLYLRQHADNPVHWQPWGPEAFALAKELDRPVIVSVGYASCHWCHVMERESFANPDVAAYQNAHFVSVKVDREERPDVDHVYLAACQVIHRSGGWPLNAFVLPDGRPFYAGTYYGASTADGRPSWRELLEHLAESWRERRDELESGAEELVDIIARHEAPLAASAPVNDARLREMAGFVKRLADTTHGGFGRAPKFPSVPTLELCARLGVRLDDDDLHDHEGLTLDRMASGGLYDQVGGGFARYATDVTWLVPHFEKMLYDNGLLLRAYADASLRRVLAPRRWLDVLRETIAWLDRELSDDDGVFHATLDADTEGQEGRFYVWRPEEFDAVFGRRTQPFRDFFGVSKRGNVEDSGATVLSRVGELSSLARALRMTTAEALVALDEAREALREVRDQRVRPTRDDKRIAAWNAWAIQGLSRAALALDDEGVAQRAARAADGLLRRLGSGEQLLRLCEPRPDGTMHQVGALLEDHAALSLALLDLFIATGDAAWLREGRERTRALVAATWDAEAERLSSGGEVLVAPASPSLDNATPSPIAMAALALLRWGALLADELGAGWTAIGGSLVEQHLGLLEQSPTSASTWLRAWDAHERGVAVLVAIVPQGRGVDLHALRSLGARHVEQDAFVLVHTDGDPVPDGLEAWLADRRPKRDADDNPIVTWYACLGRQCGLPAATPHAALAGL